MEGAYYNGQYLNRLERLGYSQAEMAIMAIRISSEFWSMTLRRLPRRSFRQNPLAETPIIF